MGIVELVWADGLEPLETTLRGGPDPQATALANRNRRANIGL